MKPGFGYTSSRVRDTERTLADTGRNPPHQGRFGNPRFRESGIHRGITVDTISQGAAGTVKLVYHNGHGFKAARDTSNALVTVEAYCYLLNADDTIPANTAVILQHFDDNTWEIISAHCDVRDWELTEEMPPSVATQQQSSVGDALAAMAAASSDGEAAAGDGIFEQDFGTIGGPHAWQA